MSEIDQKELLPCPFCGGAEVKQQIAVERIGIEGREHDESLEPEDRWRWYVRCRCCSAEGPWGKSPGSGAGWWNMRESSSTIDTLRQEAQRLRKEIEHLRSQAGPDSCADLVLQNERLTAELERVRIAIKGENESNHHE